MSTAAVPPIVARAESHAGRTAVIAPEGTFAYRALLDASARIAAGLLGGERDLAGAPVAFLVPAGFRHVAVQWGIWRAGGIAVPLAVTHPPGEIARALDDVQPAAVVVDPAPAPSLPADLAPGTRVLTPADALGATPATLPAVAEDRAALIVYTSGTTGHPKGVVTTHANLRAQVESLVTAWEWSPDDRILLVLPLHHVHGIVNVLTCALWTGATCDMLPRFDAATTWERLAHGNLTLFMAVPTIYRRLIAAWEEADPARRRAWSDGMARLRLMVSGSAALPVETLERWREITGHTLLERYGMTEFGMALSNPLHGARRPGYVGTPLPGIEVRLVDESGRPAPDGTPGEIEVRGPGVFREYWRRPDETAAAFRGEWFRTGDLAVVEDGAVRILGRASVDIIKTGGYKVSALEVENALRGHPAVADCAVVGIPDPEWGEKICVAVELARGASLALEDLQAWAKPRLAPYKIPKDLRCVAGLPRNALGKVTKPEVARQFG